MANSRGENAQLSGSRGLEGTVLTHLGPLEENLKEAFLKPSGLDYPSQCSRSRKRNQTEEEVCLRECCCVQLFATLWTM